MASQPVYWNLHFPVYFCPLEERTRHSKRKELAAGLQSCYYPGVASLAELTHFFAVDQLKTQLTNTINSEKQKT